MSHELAVYAKRKWLNYRRPTCSFTDKLLCTKSIFCRKST